MKGMAFVAAVVVLCGLVAPRARAVVAGQVDTFESGTTAGWMSGASNPTPPTNVATGGPAGAGDHYLRLNSDGSGSGGKLVAFNDAQWTGNYTTAGVTSITMDVNNLGTTALQLRLSIADATGRGAPNEASTAAVSVAPGGGWMTIAFPVDEKSLIAVSGSVASALANAKEVRLQHSPDAGVPVNIVSSLGVDNIRALPVPSQAFTSADVVTVLQIAGGWKNPTPQEVARYNVEDAAIALIDMNDAERILRKVAGLEANP